MAAEDFQQIDSSSILSAQIKLPLARPQYLVAPEVFISSLAGSALQAVPRGARGAKTGLVYKKLPGNTNSAKVLEMYPRDEDLLRLGNELAADGITTLHGSPMILAEAVAESVLGTRSAKGKTQSASPMSKSLALVQDLRGLLNTNSPPDLGKILESLYVLGAPSIDSEKGAASRLLEALQRRTEKDALLRAIDRAYEASLFGGPITSRAPSIGKLSNEWVGLLDDTPFRWFHEKWNALTSKEWVDALPARVWVDWAATVLRLALGMGYLWEASWYEALKKEVLQDTDPSWRSVRSSMSPALSWNAASLQPSMRDVHSPMRRKIIRGYALQKVIDDWLGENTNPETTFETAIQKMRRDETFRSILVTASNTPTNVKSNAFEAVKYSLSTREASGPFADYYGLLRKRGNYLVPEPGTEWVAVVASLACDGPGGKCDVSSVLSDLVALGARPEMTDLIDLLEQAGLARGSADADQGVIVQSAF